MTDSSSSRVSLRSAELSAEIDTLGAQLSALRDSTGRDLLWNGDPAIWAGRAPLLFPIVGALAGGSYRLGSKTFSLSRHGFARGKMFMVVEATATTALFRLSADEASLQIYPFRFELDVEFALAGASLSVTTFVRNKGGEEMPASVGYHPAFRWPLPFGQPRSSHFIQFEVDEPAPARRISSAGLLTPERHPTPIVQRRLALNDVLFQDDVLILDQVSSRSVTYGADNGPSIRVNFPDAPYLGLWTKPGAYFICIEPWHGITDPEGYSGDFKEKPGIFVVSPGETFSTSMVIVLV